MNETERFHEVMSRADRIAAMNDNYSPVTVALNAHYRDNEGTVDRPSDAYVHIHGGRRYVVLLDQARTLAVYRVPNEDRDLCRREPQRLRRWPAGLEAFRAR